MAASQRLMNELEKVVRDFREKQRETRKRVSLAGIGLISRFQLIVMACLFERYVQQLW